MAKAEARGYVSLSCTVCGARAYRAQTKGKVESGVKYFKGNFLPGRTFIDEQDLREQRLGMDPDCLADERASAHHQHDCERDRDAESLQLGCG